MKRINVTIVLLPILCLFLCRCGVKGDPLPPETPPEIGTGYPTNMRKYKKTENESKKQKSQNSSSDDDDSNGN